MSKNTLFNLIQIVIYPKDRDALKLVLSTHKSGAHYFRFELPTPKIELGPYLLISHHLSVYKEPRTAFDAKSQYHYTGYFKSEGKEYRLHVYFDATDTIVFKPLLSERISEDEYAPITSLEDEAFLQKFVNESIHSLVCLLRNKQEEQIKICQDKFDEFEKGAHVLYEKLPESKEEYLKIIKLMISQLDVVSLFAHPTREHVSIKKFLKSLTDSVEEIAKPVEIETKRIHKRPVNNRKQHTNVMLIKDKPNTTQSKPSIAVLAKELQNQFDKMMSFSTDFQIELLKSQYAEVNEIELFFTFGDYVGSIKDMHLLNTFKQKLELMGANLLVEFLKKGEFKQVEQLQLFYSHVNIKELIEYALHENKPLVLEFLLKNELLSIHYKNFTIHNETYDSLVSYCFKTTNETHSMLDCLFVLMEHGASMHEIEDSSGLPFFVVLVLNKDHMLGKILEHPKIDNPLFYAQTNKIMQTGMNGKMTSSEAQQIKEYIFTREKLHCMKTIQKDTSMVDDLVKQQEEYDSEIRKFFGDALHHKLIFDTDIMLLEFTFLRKLKKIIGDAPKDIKTIVLNCTKDMKPLDLAPFQDKDTLPTFEEAKAHIVLLRLEQLKMLHALRNLVDVAKKAHSGLYKNNSQASYFELTSALSSINNAVDKETHETCGVFNILSYKDYDASFSSKKLSSDLFFKRAKDEPEVKSKNVTNDTKNL